MAIQGPRSPPGFGEGLPLERYLPKGSLPLLPNLPLSVTLKMLCITIGSSYWSSGVFKAKCECCPNESLSKGGSAPLDTRSAGRLKILFLALSKALVIFRVFNVFDRI